MLKYFVIILLLTKVVYSQFPAGAGRASVAWSDISTNISIFSANENPAVISLFQNRNTEFSYSPSPFGLKELATISGAHNELFTFGNLYASYQQYGYELYKENTVTLGFGKTIQKNISVGISTTLYNLSIKNYGSSFIPVLNLGVIYKPEPYLSLGASVFNITGSSYKGTTGQIPSRFSAGGNIKFVKDLSVGITLRKEKDYPLWSTLGVTYSPVKYISLSTGISREPSLLTAGVTLNYNIFGLSYGVIYHEVLGYTNMLDIKLNGY